MTEKGTDARLFAEAALVPLACGLILLDGWVVGGGAGLIIAAFVPLGVLLGVWFGLRENFAVTNRRLGCLGVLIVVLALVLVVWG
ncbi:hypothetical protein FKR81_26720 [Lentzea tibetensis]|uniref:Uncharacterized protein n=1 Tax=Lentzea tibetensis TaxID=2591470 RepID=A0A563ENY2_9PSEU|nr:hypothetical protein [Lentzea tibetensis]TWP48889.1 hypothetical protein FKR81_26720 [Lentzea tibetensis]